MKINLLLAGTLALVLVAGFAPYLVTDAFALNLAWSGSGSSGADPLGHNWLIVDLENWGIPGTGLGTVPFLGNDWVTDFHFTVNDIPQGCEITFNDTEFRNEDGVGWPVTIMDNTIWFVAADPVADRLDPGDKFFVNIRFTCVITSIDFDAQWSMGSPIGGEILPINTTALLLAGAQTFSWMIPVVLSVLGIGLFVVSRKSENS